MIQSSYAKQKDEKPAVGPQAEDKPAEKTKEEAKITEEVDDGAVDLNDLENLNDSNITEN